MSIVIKAIRKSEKENIDELLLEVDQMGRQQVMELERQPLSASSFSEHPSVIIDQTVFDTLFNSSVSLYKQIQAKRELPEAIITHEEANFANAFLVYCMDLQKTLHEQKQTGDESHES